MYYGGQADAFCEGNGVIPNAGLEDDEEMQSYLDGEETEGVTHLTFYQRRMKGRGLCFRFIKHINVTARDLAKKHHAAPVTKYTVSELLLI
jgi:hypothetical protein